MSGTVVIEGNASQSAGATGHGGLLVVHGDAAARCGISMKGIDIVVRGSVGHLSGFMAQTGRLVVCGDAGEALGDSIYEARLYVRGSVAGLGADCVEKELQAEHQAELAELLARAGFDDARPRRISPLRLRARALQLQGRQRGRVLMAEHALEPPGVVPLRQAGHRRDPARGAGGHLRHPRLRRKAPGAPLRRPAAPRREHLALSARGLPRALRHQRDPRNALRPEAPRAEDPDHDRGHELRRAVGAGEGGARPRRDRDGDVDDHRRRRHDPGGARALDDPRLPAPPLPLRHEPRRSAQGGRDRSRRRPGREAGRRRHAPRPQDLGPRRRDARPAEGHRPAERLPASRLDRARTTSRSRSASCARSPTGRSRSSSRSARRARTTTSSSRSRRAPT